jgi:hypothetical protein
MMAELKDGRAVLDDLQKIDATYVATIRPNQNAAGSITTAYFCFYITVPSLGGIGRDFQPPAHCESG